MPEYAPQANNPVKSARNTLRIVEAIRKLDGAGVTELARELDLNKSSVYNYLSTLEEDGYVYKDSDEYHVGLRFFEIGSYARHRSPLYTVAQPEIRRLAAETGERASLLAEEHGRGIYLCKEAGDQAVRVDAHVGSRVYLHNTALGKAILAHMPEEQVDAVIERHGLPQTTSNTIVDREELFANLAEVRDSGIAFDCEERVNGLQCVAVPILRAEETICGAISVSGPATRMGDDQLADLQDCLNAAKNVIELNLSYY